MGPIRVSTNGRGFIDRGSRPFFWLGDTQWELVHGFTLAEAEDILQNRANKGFTTIQVMLTGWQDALLLLEAPARS